MKKNQSQKYRELHDNHAKMLVGYLLAGYPTADQFLQIAQNCVKAGLDIFEIGYPSHNPTFDGKVIQDAHKHTDFKAATIEYWQNIRDSISIPIWIMGYKQDLLRDNFYLELAKQRLVDCFVIPDMDYGERKAFQQSLIPYDIDTMGFVNPDMTMDDVNAQVDQFSPIYAQLYSGPTGSTKDSGDYQTVLKWVKTRSAVQTYAGFGISTPEKAEELVTDGFDGIIVGTAMVKNLNNSPETLYQFIRDIKASVRKG